MHKNEFEKIVLEMREFYNSVFSDHFTIIYGSCAYGLQTNESDLDFITVANKITVNQKNEALRFAFKTYLKYNIPIDDEVPHENKLLMDYSTLEEAISGKGFENRAGKIYVPPIIKSPEFLSSKKVSLRLALNAITSKNIFVSGNQKKYFESRELALENMVKFMYSIEEKNSFTPEHLTECLIGKKEKNGEMYLGYKEKPHIKTYLVKEFSRVMNEMKSKGALQMSGEEYFLNMEKDPYFKTILSPS